uniref:Uncharacterized protein n=1 Tax=Rhizophora mucronata TaxID=61149 RepID=A0A2P2NME6_RHIMU
MFLCATQFKIHGDIYKINVIIGFSCGLAYGCDYCSLIMYGL